MMSGLERTLVVLKPDAVGRSLIGEIISRFERAGLHMVATKMVMPTHEFLVHHYEGIGKLETRRGKQTMDTVIEMMLKLPVIAFVFEGVEAVALVRKLVGATEPKSALPGTIRGDYAHMSYGYADNKKIGIPNLIHASADTTEAAQEIPHRFTESEIFSYDNVHAAFVK